MISISGLSHGARKDAGRHFHFVELLGFKRSSYKMKKLRLFSCKYGHGQPLRLYVRLSESKSKEDTIAVGGMTTIEMAGQEFKSKLRTVMESDRQIDDLMSGILDHGNFMPLLDLLIERPATIAFTTKQSYEVSNLVAEFIREYQ